MFGDAAGAPGLALAVWALITATLVGALTANLAQLGLEMPAALKKK